MNKDWFHFSTKRLCIMGILIALQILLARLVNIPIGTYTRVNLGFLPNAVAGMLMGPFCAMLVAASGDLLGATLFPSGAIFPGFTLTAALAGINYGLWLNRRKMTWWRAVLCVLPVTLVCNIGMNTLWLYMISGDAALAAFPVRALKNLVQYPVNVALLYAVGKLMERLPAQLRSDK